MSNKDMKAIVTAQFKTNGAVNGDGEIKCTLLGNVVKRLDPSITEDVLAAFLAKARSTGVLAAGGDRIKLNYFLDWLLGEDPPNADVDKGHTHEGQSSATADDGGEESHDCKGQPSANVDDGGEEGADGGKPGRRHHGNKKSMAQAKAQKDPVIESLKKEVESLKKEVERLDKENKALKEDQKRLDDFRQQSEELRQRTEKLQQQTRELHKQKESLEKKNMDLVKSHTETVDGQKEALAAYKKRLDLEAQEKEVKAKEEELLEDEAALMKAEAEIAAKRLAELNEKYQKAQEALAREELKARKTNDLQKAVQKRLEEVKASAEKTGQRLQDLEAEREKVAASRVDLGRFVKGAKWAVISAPGAVSPSENVDIISKMMSGTVVDGAAMLDPTKTYQVATKDQSGKPDAVEPILGSDLKYTGASVYEVIHATVMEMGETLGGSFSCVWVPNIKGCCKDQREARKAPIEHQDDICAELADAYNCTDPGVPRCANCGWFAKWATNVQHAKDDGQELRFGYLESKLYEDQPVFHCKSDGEDYFVGKAQKIELEWVQNKMKWQVKPTKPIDMINDYVDAKLKEQGPQGLDQQDGDLKALQCRVASLEAEKDELKREKDELERKLEKAAAKRKAEEEATAKKAAEEKETAEAAANKAEEEALLEELLAKNPTRYGKAVERVKAALKDPARAVKLDLHRCKLGDDDLPFLLPALRSLPKLETFYLNRNQIGDCGAAALAEALIAGTAPKLNLFCIENNKFGDKGKAALTEAKKARNMLDLKF